LTKLNIGTRGAMTELEIGRLGAMIQHCCATWIACGSNWIVCDWRHVCLAEERQVLAYPRRVAEQRVKNEIIETRQDPHLGHQRQNAKRLRLKLQSVPQCIPSSPRCNALQILRADADAAVQWDLKRQVVQRHLL
jgi:hypothetical protein